MHIYIYAYIYLPNVYVYTHTLAKNFPIQTQCFGCLGNLNSFYQPQLSLDKLASFRYDAWL